MGLLREAVLAILQEGPITIAQITHTAIVVLKETPGHRRITDTNRLILSLLIHKYRYLRIWSLGITYRLI
jgi:hypothetical protein